MLRLSASATGMPPSSTEPRVGRTKPISALNRVDLPLPLTPTKAQIEPMPSSKEAPSSAVWPLR